jgi:excisionase family DNA binding protein
VTVKQAAQRIGISASLVYELCNLGVIRHGRHGRPGKRGTIRIEDEAVAEYMKMCQREGSRPAPLPLRHITLRPS